MLEHAEKAVKLAQKHGCGYCDARAEMTQKHGLVIEDGQIEHFFTRNESGIGVRVLCDGTWGFYSTSDFDRLEQGIIDAIKSAKHCATKKKGRVKLAETTTNQKKIKYKVKKEADIGSLTKIAFDCDNIIRDNNKISKSTVNASNSITSKCFISSEGTKIQQDFSDVIVDLVATAHQSGITQSISTTEGGRGGLEKITEDIDIHSI